MERLKASGLAALAVALSGSLAGCLEEPESADIDLTVHVVVIESRPTPCPSPNPPWQNGSPPPTCPPDWRGSPVPLANATVLVLMADDRRDKPTDASGVAWFGGLPTGQANVTVMARPDGFRQVQGRLVDIGDTPAEVTFEFFSQE